MPIYQDINNKELLRLLKNISVLLSIKGENPFKASAYSNAAKIISDQAIDVGREVESGTLGEIKGIGEALQKKISEFVLTGKMSYYEKLIEEIPESLLEITKISFIGPKKAKALYENEGITTLEELQQACESGRIAELKGFSEKSVEMILNSIYHKKASRGKHLLDAAIRESNELYRMLQELEFVGRIEEAGAGRRFEETVTLIEFVLETTSLDELIAFLRNNYEVSVNGNVIELKAETGIPVKLHVSEKTDFIQTVHQITGSKEYISAFEEYLRQKGIDLGGKKFNSEEELFEKAGLQYIPAELRETKRAVEESAKGNIPKLIEPQDMKGMLHVHSNWSDGKSSIEEMAITASELGYEYIGICDHSRSAGYANGLSIERVKQQHEEIDKLNEKGLGIKILKGIESDILADGSLDYPDAVMETFELVVASVHSSFNMKKDDMTRRNINALMNPYTNILGHPTGRLLLARPPYEIDIHAVIDAAVESKKIIEINCNPYRLDLSWQNVIYAKEKGLKIAVNPDSHHKSTMTDTAIGIKVARKGWLTAEDVVNTLPLSRLMEQLNTK